MHKFSRLSTSASIITLDLRDAKNNVPLVFSANWKIMTYFSRQFYLKV